jgi:uncharacterized protein YjbI with pentapeptide repeats
MEHYQTYKLELRHFGYDGNENISDFWFANKDRIWRKIFFNNGEIDVFGLHIRWESEIGKVCTVEIEKYLKQKQKERSDKMTEDFKKGIINFYFSIIDFTDFQFQYENQTYNLTTFAQLFPTSQMTGLANLRGINLDNIHLDSCLIKNCFFADASFRNSSFQQLILENTNFVSANFEDSRFSGIRFDKKSTFNGANFKNAFVNAIDLNDDNLSDRPLEFTKLGYFTLLWWSIVNLFRPIKDLKKRNQTIFLANQTNDITRPELIEFKKYVNWFQYIYKKVYRHRQTSLISRIAFFIEVLLTKYWTSFKALAVSSFVINILFSILYLFLRSDFNFNENSSIIDCFYYSIVTFTTLGYGEIHPVTSIGQIIVIFEVLIGYVVLGLFVFLISRKIDTKY